MDEEELTKEQIEIALKQYRKYIKIHSNIDQRNKERKDNNMVVNI